MAQGEPAEQWAFVCEASSCRYQGSVLTREALVRAVAAQGGRQVHVVRTGCLSLCGAGPAVVTYPAGEVHLRVVPEDAPDLAVALARGDGLARRLVRAPQWYRDHVTARLAFLIQHLKRRLSAERAQAGNA
jgi:(2Fe-2S) ferredoxin